MKRSIPQAAKNGQWTRFTSSSSVLWPEVLCPKLPFSVARIAHTGWLCCAIHIHWGLQIGCLVVPVFLLVRSIGPEPFWFPPLETLDRGGARNEVMLHKSSTRCTHAHRALAATYTGRHSTGAHVCDKRLRDRAID